MTLKQISKNSGIEGMLLTLSPVPLMLTCLSNKVLFDPLWIFIVASLGSIFCIISALLILQKPLAGKIFAGLALAFSFIVTVPFLVSDPIAALLGSIGTISISILLIHFKITIPTNINLTDIEACKQRLLWSAFTLLAIVICTIIIDIKSNILFSVAIIESAIIGQILLIHYIVLRYSGVIKTILIILTAALSVSLLLLLQTDYPLIIASVFSLLIVLLFWHSKPFLKISDYWWVTLFNNPGRILMVTFFGLCITGTFLLLIPVATTKSSIAVVDAAFTAVSAVCVTGLIVLDTPNDYTFFGQFIILILIQLGGLGIMSIASIALNLLGRKLSVQHESLLTSITNVERKDLLESLKVIVKFTFIAEAIGSVILTYIFYISGESFLQALWRGVFTAISAFCNAGFSLQTDSLIPYQNNPFILHTVAILIIFGGMAPAISLILPKWIFKKHVPVTAHIVLLTTAVLLISGTLLLLVFEWNTTLSNFSIFDKLNNAWFQSVTLRTAGFNSIDIAKIADPSYILMICFMFIGGSPGGTAGGVKTTTIAILFITFLTYIFNRNDIIIKNRRITSDTINQAITIVASGFFFWIIVVIMLILTQQIFPRDIIFEATSAIGTVGLSTGATLMLDEVGKIIIIIAMFVGRLGPITLFMLLSEGKSTPVSRYPEAKVILT